MYFIHYLWVHAKCIVTYFGNLTTPQEGAEHHPLYNATLAIMPVWQ